MLRAREYSGPTIDISTAAARPARAEAVSFVRSPRFADFEIAAPEYWGGQLANGKHVGQLILAMTAFGLSELEARSTRAPSVELAPAGNPN